MDREDEMGALKLCSSSRRNLSPLAADVMWQPRSTNVVKPMKKTARSTLFRRA